MIDETVAGTDWLHAALACTGSSDARLHSLALASWAFLASTGADPANAAIVAERALDTLDSYDDPKTEAVVAGHVRDVSVVQRQHRGGERGADR